MENIVAGDQRKACCKPESGNLGPEERISADLTFRRCRVCQCRHFEATADPLKLFSTGHPIGARLE